MSHSCHANHHTIHFTSDLSTLSSIDLNHYIINLLHTGTLLRAKSNHNPKYREIFRNHTSSICCCVIPNTRTIPYGNFESTHCIYFRYKRHVLKSKGNKRSDSNLSFRANDYQIHKRFTYFLLRITYRQLSAVDKFIKKYNSNHELFAEPSKEYTIASDTIRKRGALHNIYLEEEKLITKPILHKKTKSMTPHDLRQHALYLHHILNTPALLIIDKLYELLNITNREIITVFKLLALHKMESLKAAAVQYDHQRCIRNPHVLRHKTDATFHTLWVVKRPLNDKNAALLGCDHWALKFEGNNELMTIGFFSYNTEHGIILTKIVPNTAINRRLFWYYWPRDNMTEIESEYFNVRWVVLEKLYLGQITCDLIGILIEEWLSYNNHAKYDLTHNNCQHFVRDIIAPLNINIAKRLSSSFDVKVVKSLLPGGILAEGIDTEAKCNKLHKRLWPVLAQYKQRKSAEKQLPNIDLQQQIKNNCDKIEEEFRKLGISLSSSESEEVVENKEEEKEPQIDVDDDTDSLLCYKTNIDSNMNRKKCSDNDTDAMVQTMSNSSQSVDV